VAQSIFDAQATGRLAAKEFIVADSFQLSWILCPLSDSIDPLLKKAGLAAQKTEKRFRAKPICPLVAFNPSTERVDFEMSKVRRTETPRSDRDPAAAYSEGVPSSVENFVQ
jgi:hypothetical protein